MTRFSFMRSAAFATSLVIGATNAQAQTASVDTAKDIADFMRACVVVTHAHDYDADGQDIEIPWTRTTERGAFFGTEDADVTATASIWSSDTSYNSFCDFLFLDADFAQAAFDTFMQDQTPVTFDDQNGICVGDTFIIVEVTGPEAALNQMLNKQGHITVHNAPQYGEVPCSS